MLRDSVVAKVYDALEKSPFTVADFALHFPEKDASRLLIIKFRHDDRFAFQLVQEWSDNRYRYSAISAPGEFRASEELDIGSLSVLPELIKSWTRYVRDELRSSVPVYAELEELRKAFDEHVAQHVSDAEERFSDPETEELKSKLDALAKKFEEMQERNEITAQELNRLNQELTSIKTNLGSFRKGTWYKTAGAKLFAVVNTIVTSKESRQVLAKQATKMLGLDEQ